MVLNVYALWQTSDVAHSLYHLTAKVINRGSKVAVHELNSINVSGPVTGMDGEDQRTYFGLVGCLHDEISAEWVKNCLCPFIFIACGNEFT